MSGVLEDLVSLLGEFSPRLVTYAGGASSVKDLDRVGACFLTRNQGIIDHDRNFSTYRDGTFATRLS